VKCEQASRLLDAYVDQELFLKDSLEIEKHLRLCSSCDERYKSMASMQQTIKKCKRHKPSMSLQDRIQTQLRTETSHESLFKRLFQNIHWSNTAASFAMGVLVSLVLSLAILDSGSSNQQIDEILASHIRSMMESHLTDVETSDKHQIKPWVNKVLDYAPPVEDLSEKGYPLIGARLDYIDQRKVVSLVYQLRNHYINVFILPIAKDNKGKPLSTNKKGFAIHQWSFNQLSYIAIADLSENDLHLFAKHFRAATLSL